MSGRRGGVVLAAAVALAACAGAGAGPTPGEASTQARAGTAAAARRDSVGTGALVPAGYGNLRQDDVSVRLQLPGLQVRLIPLDETIIRVLSPDSYRALRDLQERRRPEIELLARRAGVRQARVWYVSFFGIAPEARFSPREVIITNAGRDFRPVELVPLTAGFGEGRLRTRERQDALYLFGEELDVNQPLTVRVEGSQSDEWAEVLRRIERERALIRSRAGRGSAGR